MRVPRKHRRRIHQYLRKYPISGNDRVKFVRVRFVGPRSILGFETGIMRNRRARPLTYPGYAESLGIQSQAVRRARRARKLATH